MAAAVRGAMDDFEESSSDEEDHRVKSLFSAPIWRLYSEGDDQFLMSAQKRGASRTSNFLLATELVPTRGSGRVVGKVRSNFAGSVYTIFDSGMAPEDAVTDASLRRELAVVGFDWDQMGPGKMRAAVPRVHKNGAPFTFRAREAVDSLAAAAAHADSTRVVMLKNKRPQWDDSVGGHVLNFGGRVTCPSVKNFQMGSDESEDATLLQFGKVDKDRFTLDFQHPLCHVQAFGIVMAAIDGKLADRRALKRFSGKTPEEDGGAWFAQWADPPAPET
ncbi:hypothetical protein FNF31_04201 [Cafeteria roenbergensis]|uniref:Tubby C-terminal domain-containing protein n=1 Tax=Cafeteria roenbergensis TaxID=33653 RepID=A0A5A8D8N3_CAFRO|nr:hypothetical protein FNF31_04201 [Cafeteria roenbergensis]